MSHYTSNERRRWQAPLEVWLFVVGFLAYGVAPMLPQVGYVPANPVALFAAAAGVVLIAMGDRRRFWAAVAMGLLAVLYPLTFLSSWLNTSPSLGELYWVLLTPALLQCLLCSPRVRCFAKMEGAEEFGRDQG